MKSIMKKSLFIILALALLALSATPLIDMTKVYASTPSADIDTAILEAIAYIQTQQNDDGGIRWIDDSSSMPVTIRVVLALSSIGFPQNKLISQGGNSPIDYLANHGYTWVFQTDADEPTLNIARAGQLLTAVSAANQDPHAFGKEAVNLIHLIKNHFDPNTGVFGNATPNNVTDQVWAMLGLASAYASVPQEAAGWLSSAQLEDGSWDDGFGSYLDMTPLGVLALMSSGFKTENDPEIALAYEFIRASQSTTGGWQTDWDTTTNANTTGMMLQSIYAMGHNPTDSAWVRDESSPLDALFNLQQEGGAIGGDFTNAYSTADAILGLSGKPLYDLGHLRKVGRAFEYIFAAQGDDGGWGNVGQTLDVMIAAHAAGWDPVSISRNGRTPLSYITENLEAYLENGPDAIGKILIGLTAANQDPENFEGFDLVSTLLETYNPNTNAFGSPDNTWHQALSILGLYAAKAEAPEGAVQTLLDLQLEDGGWEYSPGFGSWPDNTALAIQALLAAGIPSDADAIQNGLSYIQANQLEDGGWGDSSTSASVIMALNALDIDPQEWQVNSEKTPLPNLLSYQNNTGAFRFSKDYPEDNLMATTTAILAAVGGDYFIHAPERTVNMAGLVVVTDQHDITTACVSFEEDSISGLALLDASGMPYQSQDGFMNNILNTENPQGGTMYWSYWHWDGRDWVFNNTGAGDSLVLPGSIEAWYFTSWELFPSLPPDYVPHLQVICEENALKNYAIQPYINYYDLFQMPDSMSLSTSYVPVVQPGEPVTTSTDAGITADSLPITPIIIIGVVGLIVLALILLLLFRKK